MIACGVKTYTYTSGGTSTPNTYYATDTTGWYEVETWPVVMVVSEPQQEADDKQDEDTGGRAPVTLERHHRRLATVTGRAPDRPRQQASGFG